MEEAKGGVLELLLVDTPSVTEVVQDSSLAVENLNCSLLANVLKTDDTVGDTRRSEDADPTNLGGVISMGSTAGLSVDAFDVDNTERVAWHDTALV